MRLYRRLAKLEASSTPPAQGPRHVVIFVRDPSGTWRSQKTGEALPDAAEIERTGLFVIKIGCPADFGGCA